MAVYILLYLVIGTLAILYPKNKKIAIGISVILCFFAFFRGFSVGTDVADYSANFMRMNKNPLSWSFYIPFEPGFNYFIFLFKQFVSENPLNCWGTLGIIYVWTFHTYFKRYTENINIAFFLFLVFGTYFLSYNIMRQCFGCSLMVLLLAFLNIEKMPPKQITVFIITTIGIGILIHPSILIFLILPLYYAKWFQLILTKKIYLALLVFSFFIFYTQAVIPLITSLVDTTSAEGKLVDYALRNIQSGEDSNFSLIKMLLITGFQCYLVLISPNPKNIFLYLGTAGVLFLNFFGILVVEFARIYELLMGVSIVYMASLWDLEKTNYLNYFYRMAIIGYGTMLFLNILTKNYGEIVPYVFR